MALPKITHPVFKITIPSTKKALNFRPYTVKEEKLLLFVKDNDNLSESIDVLKQIINNCCVDGVDVNKLALFDIEYIFIKLRARSVDSTIELNYRKGTEVTPFVIDLNSVEIKFDPKHERKFIVYDNIGVSMNYPTFDDMSLLEKNLKEKTNADNDVFDLFINCIDTVFDDNKVYDEFTKEEIEEFIFSLPRECIEKIKTFFDTMPVLEHKQIVKYKDGSTEEVVLRGLKDFFIF
jgi:hypothetical protein